MAGANETGRANEGDGTAGERSSADLVRDLSQQTAKLAQQEVALAKAEMTVKGRRVAIGAGALGTATVPAILALGAFTAAAVLGLAEVVEAWLAALIVGGAYTLIAAIAALIGRQRVKAAAPPVPERAIESSKEDAEWVRTRARRR